MLRPGQFQEVLWAAQRRAGRRRIKVHDLRHSYASILASSGMPPFLIRGLLGHSSVKPMRRSPNQFLDGLFQADRIAAMTADSIEELCKVIMAVGAVSYGTITYFERLKRRQDENRLDAKASRLKEKAGVDEAISTYTQRLGWDIEGLKSRARWSFVPGLLLCIVSVCGPWLAYTVAKSTGKWEFMLAGSATAAVLLGAGSTLLRHDNKIREQIQASQSELLYFRRLQAGLECALNVGEHEYKEHLKVVIDLLIAAPPRLEVALVPKQERMDTIAPTTGTLELIKNVGESVKTLLETVTPKEKA